MSKAREVTATDRMVIKDSLYCDVTRGILIHEKCDPYHQYLVGTLAGSLHKSNGYMHVRLHGKQYLVHRIVWFFATGKFPTGVIDHINGDKTDNRIANLREVSGRQNGQNQNSHREGRLAGCTFHKRVGRWQAQCGFNGKKRHLGYFDTELEAHERYCQELTAIGETLLPPGEAI